MPRNAGTMAIRELYMISQHLQQLIDAWQGKAILGALCALAAGLLEMANVYFGADALLIQWLVAVMCADFALGVIQAFKNKRFNRRQFYHGALKFMLYPVYLLLVGISVASLARAIGVGHVLFNLFAAYLIACEVLSILKNMERLGIKHLKIVSDIIHGAQRKIEHSIKETYKVDDDENHPD